MAELQDVSTIRGSLSKIWFRWKYKLLALALAMTLLLAISHVVQNYGNGNGALKSSGDSTIPESTFVVSGSKLLYYGNEGKFDSRYFDHFPGLPSSMENLVTNNIEVEASRPIDTIEIKWVRISGPNFTAELSKYASSLRFLRLENVTIEGHLESVYLPQLEEFFLSQGLEPEENNTPDYILNHGPTPWLLSTLFFINDKSQDFPTKAAIAYNRPINVTVFLKGSVAYQLNPGFNEVRLDISNCTDVLKKLPQTFKILTLGRCKDLTPTSIHSRVTFLNFYIVYVSSELLSAILKNLKDLEEFYAEIPDGQVEIRLQDLSSKLRILSISSMNIVHSRGSYPSIKEFYFGAENQYGWLDSRITTLNETISDNFEKIFPNVEKVGLFEIQDPERYVFLKSVLQTPSVKWLLVENFGRGKYYETDVGVNINAYIFVENYLDKLGLSKEEVDFVIENDQAGNKVGRVITPLEKLWYRFTYLGWCPIDSWPKFMYVEGIIVNGGILGENRRKNNTANKISRL